MMWPLRRLARVFIPFMLIVVIFGYRVITERDNPDQDQNFLYEATIETSVMDGVSDSEPTDGELIGNQSTDKEVGAADETSTTDATNDYSFVLSSLPDEVPEEGYVYINDNVPAFSEDEITTTAFEEYGQLDELGRCTYTISCIDISLMPTESRGDISSIYPTGWEQATYDFIDNGGYLYNRCHLIGFQLTGENANEKNLITGTRFLNLVMLEFENEVADYVKNGGTVLYRVIPIFEGDNLLASGVTIEALSVSESEDEEDISFYVYCYNIQPGVEIDYATGENKAA